MKELSTGVQGIQELITGNYVYVDKTHLIQDLLQKKGNFLLTRPRRFGKTLLLETLKAIFQGKKEGASHAFFLLFLEAMEIRVNLEDLTTKGHTYCVELSKVTYIFEFMKDKISPTTLQKYLKSGKEIVVIGVNFSSKTRNISSWQATIYNAKGMKKRELSSAKLVNRPPS